MAELDQCNVVFSTEDRNSLIFVCLESMQLSRHGYLWFQAFVKVYRFGRLLPEDAQPYHLFVLILIRIPSMVK